MKFKIGELVRVKTKRWDWKGKIQFGLVGVVESIDKNRSLHIRVVFPENYENSYAEEDLEYPSKLERVLK